MSEDRPDGDTPSMSRRKALKTAGILGTGAIAVPGTASASQSADNGVSAGDGGVEVENGKFVLDATPEEIGQTTYGLTEAAVSNFNAAIEAGYFSIDGSSTQGRLTAQQAEQTSLTVSEEASAADLAALDTVEYPSVSLDRAREREDLGSVRLAPQSCNRNGVTTRRKGLPPTIYVNIYMSNGFINDAGGLAAGGGITGRALYDLAKARGLISAGLLSGPVALAAFATVGVYWTLILIKNNGCGVRAKTGISPLNPTVVVPTVVSQ